MGAHGPRGHGGHGDDRAAPATAVEGFDVGDDGRVRAVARPTRRRSRPTSSSSGSASRPNVDLAREAGLTIGESGGIATDVQMRCVGHDERVGGRRLRGGPPPALRAGVAIALGTHANKHGRIIGTNLAGGYGAFPGVLGTAISKVCSLEIGRTGLGEARGAARPGSGS